MTTAAPIAKTSLTTAIAGMIIFLIRANVTRNQRRMILTILSIAVSIFIFAGLTSLPSLIAQILRERANSQRLVYNKDGYFYSLPSAYARRLESIKHVEHVIDKSIPFATYRSSNDQVPALAAEPEHFAEVFDDRGIAVEAARGFVSERTGALVRRTLMSHFRWKIGDLVLLHGLNAPIDIQLMVDLAWYSMIIITSLSGQYYAPAPSPPGSIPYYYGSEVGYAQ